MRPEPIYRCKTMLLALTAMLLVGCATGNPTISRYVLPASAAPVAPVAVTAPVLRIALPHLSGLVDQRGLLLQTSDIQVHAASHHQWAEDLAPQLQRRLIQRLSAQLPAWQLQPATVVSKGQLLRVWVDQFQGRFDGMAVVSGRWQLLSAQHKVLQTQAFLFEKSLANDGYPALVHSLDQAWKDLAEQIAQVLKTSVP